MDNSKKAIIQTLVYSDLFGYPLRKRELWRFLKYHKKIPYSLFNQTLLNSTDPIAQKNNYYFLKNKENIVNERLKKTFFSKEKYYKGKKIAKILSFIPTIQFIGISGSLAMNNADQKDDIDLFIITSHKTMWATRFLLLFILFILGVNRRKNDKEAANKICINMFLDEAHLQMPISRQDMYTAQELAQIRSLFDRNYLYDRLLKANPWITHYMPNISYKKKLLTRNKKVEKLYFSSIEIITKKIQMITINRTKTTETVTDSLLAFHPYDYRKKTLYLYTTRIKQYSNYFSASKTY